MERKFVYFCPNCNEYRKYNSNQSNKFICKICGNRMLYKGIEDKDERKKLKKIYIQNELEKEKKEKTTKKEVIYPSSQPEENIPRCPTCHSTKIKKIGAFERMASVGFWGPFSKKINKTFKCENCGYTW